MKYLIPVLLILFSCKSQTINISSCGTKIEYQYDDITKEAKKEGLVVDIDVKSVTLYFMNHFDHEVQCRINDELLLDEHIKTVATTGTTDKYISYLYEEENSYANIKINLSSGECIEFNSDKKYMIIYVFFSNNGFVVRYSNRLYENI